MKKVKFEIDSYMGVTFNLFLGGKVTSHITSFSHLKKYHGHKHRKGGLQLYSNLNVWVNGSNMGDVYFTYDEIFAYVEHVSLTHSTLDKKEHKDAFLEVVKGKLVDITTFEDELYFAHKNLWVSQADGTIMTFLTYIDS